jgi:hypothetical protein
MNRLLTIRVSHDNEKARWALDRLGVQYREQLRRGPSELLLIGFLAQLLPPLVLNLQATTLVPSTPQSIESWRDHFYSVRRRFFALNIAFAAANPLANFAAGADGQNLFAPAPIAAISVVGILSDSHRAQSGLALFALLGNVVLVAVFSLNPATSPFG